MGWEFIAKPKRMRCNGKLNSIVVSFEKACGKQEGMAIAFRIGIEIAKAMRWQKGDRVAPVRDGDMVGLRRLPSKSSDGWILSQSGGSSLRFKMVNDDLMKLLTPGEVVDPLMSGDVVVIGEAKKVK